MPSRRENGDNGELEVARLAPCPNCGKNLMTLPKNYPLVDLQCTGCSFRAQVKTNSSKPRSEIFGAGWDIMEKVLKSGHTVPPLIVNFKWTEKDKNEQIIKFYPFIPRKTLSVYSLPATHKQPNYKMFKYTSLDKLPNFTLFELL